MTQTPGPRRLVGVADDYSRALDELERRSSRNIITTLRQSLEGVLLSLRRSYALYLEDLGPQGFDPAGQPIRRPGSYSAAEATAKYRAILRDAQQFMTEEELRVWSAGYERDLREASRLGGQLETDLLRLVGRPDAEVPFTGADPLAIRAATLTTSAFIQNETARFRDQLAQIVGEGATRGWGSKRLEISIRQALRGARDPNGITQRLGLEQRAALIARTELANAYSQGALIRARQEGFAYVRVLASNDERVCPTCASRNGRVFPVDRVVLPFHPRCVLGDVQVSPGLLAAVFRSRYRGYVIAIGLANGERLQVTVDHPVLTPSGWVKAERLRKGDQILGHGLNLAPAPSTESPDLHEMPATAEEVFAAFADACAVPPVAVPVTALDLHGDGQFIEGDVEVVRADGLLQGYWMPEANDGVSNGQGIRRRVRFRPFTALRDADGALLWHAATAASSVGRRGEALAILRGGLGHAEEHRLAAAAWRDPVLAQEGGDGVPLHAEGLGDGLDAAALAVHPQGSGLVVDRSVASEGDTSQLKVPVDHVPGNTELFGHVGSLHPGLVELHEVVSVEVNPFHGFVYTFETFCGAYAMGRDVRVISRNCRCVAVPVPDEAVEERNPAMRATLLDADRWQAEHERGVEAFADGQHQERIDVLRRQVERAKDGDAKDALSAQLEQLIDRGPDMVKARLELNRALRTPTASEKRLFPGRAESLQESVPLFDLKSAVLFSGVSAAEFKQHVVENSFTLPGRRFKGADIADMVNTGASIGGEVGKTFAELRDFVVKDKQVTFVSETFRTTAKRFGAEGVRELVQSDVPWAFTPEYLQQVKTAFGVDWQAVVAKRRTDHEKLLAEDKLLKKQIADAEARGWDPYIEKNRRTNVLRNIKENRSFFKTLSWRHSNYVLCDECDGFAGSWGHFVTLMDDSQELLHGSFDHARKPRIDDLTQAVGQTLKKRSAPGPLSARDDSDTFDPRSKLPGQDHRNESVLYTYVHETGHQIYYRSNAVNPDGDTPKGTRPSGYADMNNDEFFAESFAAYVFNPDALKAFNPEIHSWVQSRYREAMRNAGPAPEVKP